MKPVMKYKSWILAGFLFVLFTGGLVVRGDMVPFSIEWWTIDNGGGESQAGAFTVVGTIGQMEAGHEPSDGVYSVTGGFWPAGMGHPTQLFLPIVAKPPAPPSQ